MVSRPDAAAFSALVAQPEPTASPAPPMLSAANLGPSVQLVPPAAVAPQVLDGPRAVQASVHVLEPNYTIAAGDTLVKIAARFNTSVERIQAFNKLADPRALHIGTQLVIPPPL